MSLVACPADLRSFGIGRSTPGRAAVSTGQIAGHHHGSHAPLRTLVDALRAMRNGSRNAALSSTPRDQWT